HDLTTVQPLPTSRPKSSKTRQGKKNGNAGYEAKQLRPHPDGSDGKVLELARDSITDEFLRDLRQEHAEAEPSQDEGDRESAPAGQGPGREPNPRKAPDRSGNRLPQGTHADRTPGASLEPMPAS